MTAAVFAAAFALYLGCAYPAIAPRDSADLASAAMTLGVAHPPGYPLYSVAGRAWLTAFPLGNPAYALNAFSAAAGAAAAAMLFFLVRRRSGLTAGLTASLMWTLSAPLWKFSLLEEMYSLHAVLAVSVVAMSEGDRDSVFSRARLTGLLLGLGLVNHQSLIFWIPTTLLLWKHESSRHAVPFSRIFKAAVPPLFIGLSLYAFVWVRLGSFGPALAAILRARYGSATLYAGFSRPLTPETGGELLAYALRAGADAVSLPAFLAACAGAGLAWKEDRPRAAAWLLGAALAGPLFVLLSRFDPDVWVARSILEPAFLLPALVAAAFAGEAVGALSRRSALQGGAAALALLAGCAWLRAPLPEHRDDFLAYDYVRDLRRAVPPGAPLLTAGDTASFGLGWLALARPESAPRDVAPLRLTDARAWLAARTGGPAYLSGIGPDDLAALGLPSRERPLAPEGLVQELGVRPPRAEPLSVLRRPRAWARDESYARDAKLSYAFASWASARLLEKQGVPAPESFDLTAAAVDPEDYHLQ